MAINKEYNDIQLDVKFTQASTRANLVSEENISVSFGKISKYFADLHSQAFTGYKHPTHTAYSSGLYKITVDELGHVSGTAAVTASDLPAHTHSDYVLKTGDTMSGNLTFAVADGSDTPGIVFKRGNFTDSTLDWKIYNSSGALMMDRTVAGDTETWQNKFKVDGEGIWYGGTKVSLVGHTHNYAGSNSTGGSALTVYGTLTNPSGQASYAIPFHTDISSGDKSLLNNDGIVYTCKQGTASATGYGIIELGNAIDEGTAGNKYGLIRLYSRQGGGKYVQLYPVTKLTANRNIMFPNAAGTVALTTDIPTVNDASLTLKGGGTDVVIFTANAANNKSLDITAGANVTINPTVDSGTGIGSIEIASSHPTITKSADTTSTASPGHGGTFTVVDSVIREANGHVTKINTKTVTLPNDTSMTQTNTTGSADYRVLLSGNANDTTETTTGRKSTNLKFNPSTGVLSASSGVTTKTITRSALKGMLTGSGTAAQDKGSGVSPRYFPAKWTFNTGLTAANGDVFIIKLPTAGHSYGVFLSIDNGANYYPISVSGTSRLTTHYGNGYSIAVMFKSDGSTADMFPLTGGDSRSTVTGGCWQVLNYYDSGNSNTYDRNKYNANIKAGSSALVAGNIIVGKDGVFNHLKSGGTFDISYPILYLNAAVAANATTTDTYDILHITITTTQSITLTAYKPVFIKGTLSGTIFTSVSATPLTQTVPTTDDGYVYIYLGNATSTTTMYLQERHPIYAYKNGAFGEITNYSTNAGSVAWDNVTGKPSTFTPASGSDYYVKNLTGSSRSTATTKSWVSMCNSTQTGAPTLPTSGKWWHVLSLDCWNSAPNNWVSQLALPTQDDSSIYYRKNSSSGTSIESGTWIKVLDSDNYTSYTVKKDGTGATGSWGINITGNSANVTGTVAITNGGTGATTRLNALKNLTNENVGTSATYFLTITDSWGKGGYTSVANAKTVLGLKSAAYTESSEYAPSSHTHGNITSGGALQTTDITIASGDKLVVTDSSNSNKVARTSISFDGSTATKCLTQKGTWETFAGSNTDRYVNSAAFTDDSTNTAASPVKMTLTRAGSDTATVTANIPKVSSTSAGVAPKGTTVSSQSQSTKFLREDGSWAAPSYTSIPSNNVTGSGTSGCLAKWNGTNTITNGPLIGSSTTTFLRNDGSWATPPDTKNTAGSTDTSSKIFLIGATSQAANPQTYSDNEVYTTSGVLTTKKVQVGGGSCTMEYNSTTQSLDFIFT